MIAIGPRRFLLGLRNFTGVPQRQATADEVVAIAYPPNPIEPTKRPSSR
jgi:hypothetical protein